MKTTRTLLTAVTLSLSLFAITGANAALMASSDSQTIYDTEFNITWLSNANLAAANTFGVSGINSNGTMDWNAAQHWIGAMNTANYLGYHDWRLPTTLQPDASCSRQDASVGSTTTSSGLYCTGSEMGHLFYSELGGRGLYSITATHNANYGLFSNVQSALYWSATEYELNSANAWGFVFDGGLQGGNNKNSNLLSYALAVRTGQVSAVPVPAAAWLLSSGLLGLVGVARRRTA